MKPVCKHCQKTRSDILSPCDYEEVCYDLKKLTDKGENVRLIKICSGCGLSHSAVKYKGMPCFPQECYCSTVLGSDSLCFCLGTADDFCHDPAMAEDIAKQKWVEVMVMKDTERRNKQAEQRVINETRKRHEQMVFEQTMLRDQVNRLAYRQILQQENRRPATAPTTRIRQDLRVHTVDEHDPPQYAQLQPPYDPQQQERMPLMGERTTSSFQIDIPLGHENRSVGQTPSRLA